MVITSPPRSTGITELGENLEVIYGAQSLAGKNIGFKELRVAGCDFASSLETGVRSADHCLLANDGATKLWNARSDVTRKTILLLTVKVEYQEGFRAAMPLHLLTEVAGQTVANYTGITS